MLKKPKRVNISIDMTPMVDIAFLLLIFFMSTTQFQPPEKEQINLPDSRSPAKAPESKIITVSVTKAGGSSVEYRGGRELRRVEFFGPEDFRVRLREARVANPAAYIMVRMDEEAKYGQMEDIMRVLQEENATRFNIVTDLKAPSS
jgi:biopolymer transport protein ExbD